MITAAAVREPPTVPHRYLQQRTRDDARTPPSSREPFLGDETSTEDRGPFTQGERPTEVAIEELVEFLTTSIERSSYGLPTIVSPELGVIGRAVSFAASKTVRGSKTTYYYTGLVSAVTATTVTLIHVNRYTEADFELYKKRERALSHTSPATAQDLMGTGNTTASSAVASSTGLMDGRHGGGLVDFGYSTEGEVGVDRNGQLSGDEDNRALLCMDAAGSLACAAVFDTSAEPKEECAAFVMEARAPTHPHARRRLLPNHKGSVGPLPFVTVQRKMIHGAKFGRDPRSSFFSLFQTPSREVTDMQYLRMLVRRYIVHTSQGNNAQQVSLSAFVAARSECATLDQSFLHHLVCEELPDLLKIDRAIQSEKRPASVCGDRWAAGNVRRHDEVPSGTFARTDVLYHECLPRRSFITGLVILVFTVIAVVFLSVSVAVVRDPFVATFLLESLRFVVPTLGVWTVAAVATIRHAFFMPASLCQNVLLLLTRAVLCVAGMGCSMMCIAMLLFRMSNGTFYDYMTSQAKDNLCAFYKRNRCSGLYSTCNGIFRDPALCRLPCSTHSFGERTCSSAMWNPVQVSFVPLIVLSAIMCFACFYSLTLVVKVVMMGCRVTRRRN